MTTNESRTTRRGAALGLLAGGLSIPAMTALGGLSASGSTLPGNGPEAGNAPGTGQVGHNIRLVTKALQVVFSEHRIDKVDTFFSADFVQHSPYAAPGGREELKKWWAGIVYSIPDVTTSVTQTLGQDQDVLTFREVKGTIVNDLPDFGIEGRGQHVEFLTADIFRVRRNKIVAHWEVADTGPFVALAADST